MDMSEGLPHGNVREIEEGISEDDPVSMVSLRIGLRSWLWGLSQLL